ncbi:MAG: tetratricopeptide repeat protein, partial [Betaproteobacteria bacterium]|nr:tetratricopeptide repeat protein [Betaproteobacteria bacterium]
MAQANPGLVRTHLEDGLRAHSEGRLDSARDAYAQALAIAPDHPDALNLLGTAWLQLGDAGQAVGCLERAAQQRHNHPGVLGNLAQAYFALGRYDEAEDAFRQASRLDPRNVYFQMGVANSLGMQGRLAEAENSLRKLAVRFPAEPLVWFNLGNALREQKRLQDALPCYLQALDIDPELFEAHNNLGSVLHALYRFDDAERKYRACIAMAPDYLVARYNLASLLIAVGRFLEAEEICREITRRDPAVARAYSLLSAALGRQGRLREALECSRRVAELAPQDAKIVAIYASMLAEAGAFGRALRGFARALALSPDLISGHQLLGNALLSQGCLADGWLEYGYRPAFSEFRQLNPGLTITQTLPAELEGHPLCVLREQGLGDELFFMRFGPQLSALGARITYYASNKLRSLFERIAWVQRVLDETVPLPERSTVMLAGDLPHALSTGLASSITTPAIAAPDSRQPVFPYHISVFWPSVPPSLLITPLAEQLTAVQSRLAQAGAPPYLGLTWRGGIAPREQGAAWSLYKEIGIESFAQALQDFPGTLIAFQRNPKPGEIEAFSRAVGKEVRDFSDLNENLEGMLAALALADEYVGVSNTNMHLRAAAGRTARVLLPCPAEWRWMAAGASYPG